MSFTSIPQSLRHSVRNTIAIVLAGCLCQACSTISIPEYTSQAPSAFAQKSEVMGVHVTADPFFNRAAAGKYFRINPYTSGVAIVHLHFHNTTPNQTFLIRKSNMRFVRATDDSGLLNTDVSRSSAVGEAVMLTGAAVLSLPLLFAGAKAISDKSAIEHNFTSQEFGDRTISPGQTAEGFVYYKLNGREHWGNGAHLEVKLLDTKTESPLSLSLQFNHPQP